eukprot:TRINITY_DN793_c0_g1_i14.p1 TRINITY_DN793_c0_g1~~TRINITY_DN793_c0_g1_i14.p1  ORF type:complete len:101 (+),score=20.15 TRINITY_DN793_c0_g1_i14:260-562(+)
MNSRRVFLKVVSAMISAASDMTFDSVGYAWMTANCFFSSAYTLSLRYAMQGTRLSDFAMAMYNNVISIPFLVSILYLTGELQEVSQRCVSDQISALESMI